MPKPDSADQRIALCVARFYDELADRLEAGARAALADAGVADVDVFDVPGAFELPLIAKYAALSGRYDYVCGEAARGIQQVQLETGVPCGFGVLTVDSVEQASERVQGGSKRDTGRHAVDAVLASLAVKEALAGRRGPAGFAVS